MRGSGLTHLFRRRASPQLWLLTVFHAWVDSWGYHHVIPCQTSIVEIGGTSERVDTITSCIIHCQLKLGCLMYKSLSGQAPQYMADDVQLVFDSGRRRLRSASDRTCVVPRTHNSFGNRSFSAAGPRVRNALPPELRHDISFGLFRRKLTSHLLV